MTSKAMWEVDPETRSKLLAIQKESKNNICCDCNAPSPQWASPKFGVFICLSCAGVHRGLGVHISFVRSISMDAFKPAEIERMRLGGNETWRAFFENHDDTKLRGLSWDDATIAERYGGEAGDEYKERLSAKVEGREYVAPEKKPAAASAAASRTSAVASRSPTPGGGAVGAGRKTSSSTNIAAAARNASRSSTPLRGASGNGPGSGSGAASRTQSPGRVKVDDKYFAQLGADNASRPDDVPPSQGGKYGGFGNTPAPGARRDDPSTLPGFGELQKDPVAALSKGFGWFTSTVSRTAKSVNDDFIQPTAKQIAESDIAAQARVTAATVARSAQAGARSAHDGFNRFVEGPEQHGHAQSQVPIDETKKDFWDDFSALADRRAAAGGGGGGGGGGSAIGTSAMMGGKDGGRAPAKPSRKEEWDDW